MTGSNQNKRVDKDDRAKERQSIIGWRHLGVAAILGLVSLIDEWQVTDVLKISGGPTLVALAVVVLLWPVVRQVGIKGGEIDIKGLRLKVNQIEHEAVRIDQETKRIESDNAMKIQELESQVEEILRTHTVAGIEVTTDSEAIGEDASVLEWAASSYRDAVPMQDFRKRVEIDKEIIRRGRRLSFATLRSFLSSRPHSAEAQMVVAVALGLPPRDEEQERASLLAELVRSRHERVRARSGQAAKRWAERRTADRACRAVLLGAIEERLVEEAGNSGARGYLEKARDILANTLEWGAA